MSSGGVRVVGLTDALGVARLGRAEREAVAAELLALAQVLQRIDLLLQGTRIRGDLPPIDEEVVAPDVIPNTLRPYLDIEAVPAPDERPQSGAAGAGPS